MKSRITVFAVFLACIPFALFGQMTGSSGSWSANGDFSFSATFSPPRFPIMAVVGAPYSAEQINENTQILNDGTRIVRPARGFTRYYRDSAGRTRTERPFGPPVARQPDSPANPLVVEINDPVSGYMIILDTVNLVAHRAQLPPAPQTNRTSPSSGIVTGMPAPPPPRASVRTTAPGTPPSGHPRPDFSSEPLGTRMIEGVLTQGTRTTYTHPAGEMGNDRPFTVIHESWYSPELRLTVMMRADDPRSGESVNRYTNIDRSEPDPALFQIPPGYQVVDETDTFTIKISRP